MNRFHQTAIVRRKPSLPLRWLIRNNLIQGRVLDFGCGRGFDANFINAEKYDPYGYPDYPKGKFDTIICIYVLNIVDEKTQYKIIKSLRGLLDLKGQAFLAVRRDKQCKEHQRWVELDLPIVCKAKGRFCIYKLGGRKC